MVETIKGTGLFTQDGSTESREDEVVINSIKCWGEMERMRLEKMSLDLESFTYDLLEVLGEQWEEAGGQGVGFEDMRS